MTVDELFGLAQSRADGTIQFIIDENLRIISVPSSASIFGVEYDKDVNTIGFVINRYYSNVDLSEFSIRISFKNANNEMDFFDATEIVTDDDAISFCWTLGASAFKCEGAIHFAVNFIKADSDGSVIQAYNTTIAEGEVLEGLNVNSADIPESEYSDLIIHINKVGSQQVQAVQTAGTAAVGDVNDARDDAVEEIETANAHAPQVNDDTGYWQTWDAETGQYVDTTTKAEGPEGPQGPKGDTGAPGMSSAEFDAMFAALLDGKNTTQLFWLWWPASDDGTATKYARLERWAKLLAAGWQDKTYTLRFYNDQTSGDYNGTPMDDLADGREAAPLVTDASEPVDDWTENDPMTWYIRGNALSLADGTMNVLAVEGETGFDVSGESAPVYCFAMSVCMKEWGDGTYIYNSWRSMSGGGYNPMKGDVPPGGGRRWLTWHPAFHGGKNSTGGMTSGAGLPPMQFTSASSAIALARKITAYDALWTDCDQQYAMSQWRLRHWTLSNSGKLEGCTSYNYQYALAVAESGVKRVIVTKARGANFIVGSAVCVGERGENTNNDRNQSYMWDVVAWARITSIDDVVVEDITYSALSLDIEDTITTTTTMYVSTMPWESGTTECLPGHSDGCRGNLTNGKYPYRVAGIEMQIGAYIEQLDPLWNVSVVDDHWHYDIYSCRDGAKQASSITEDYEKVGEFDLPDQKTYTWNYIRAIGNLGDEAIDYKKFGGSSSTYLRAGFLSPGAAGLRAPWRGGHLHDDGACGLPGVYGSDSPGTAYWYGVPRLAGSGKTRGVWGGDTE